MKKEKRQVKVKKSRNFAFLIVLFSFSFLFFNLAAPSANAATISKPMQSLGLVGYWSFDVGKGTAKAVDMSGRGNNGTLTNMNNADAWVGGKIGNALSFDGVDDYVQVGNPASLNISGNITVSAWVQQRAGLAQSNRPIVARWGTDQSYIISVSSVSSNLFVFCIRVADVNKCAQSISSYGDGKWHHVVGRFDGVNALLTIDNGVESIVGDATAGPIDTPAENVVFGNYSSLGTPFTGLIDDVRIYNRALSADEIKRLYRQTNPQFNASQANKLRQGLVGMWTFDGNDMSGNTAIDRSGNGNNGTLTNGPKKVIGKIGQGLYISEPSCVQVSQSSSINTLSSFTISLWAKPTVAGKIFLHKGDPGFPSPGWAFVLTTTGTRRLEFTQSLTAGSISVLAGEGATALGEWQYFTVTVDGSGTEDGVHFYRNGVKLSHTNHFGSGSGGPADDSAYGLKIGADEYANCISGTGNQMTMDEVRIYNRVITPAEIRQLYKAGSSFHPNVTNKSTIRDGLVGHWSFDGNDMGTTSARDASGAGNTGWLINGTKKAIGKIGQALNFDGVNDYVNVPHSAVLTPTGDYTISAWIRTSTTENHDIIVGKFNLTGDADGYILAVGDATAGNQGKITFWTGGAWTVGVRSVDDGLWHYAVGVLTGSTANIYIDGILDKTDLPAAIARSSTNVLTIGKRSDDLYNGWYLGLIDEVRVYNRALSPDEIKRLYNMGR